MDYTLDDIHVSEEIIDNKKEVLGDTVEVLTDEVRSQTTDQQQLAARKVLLRCEQIRRIYMTSIIPITSGALAQDPEFRQEDGLSVADKKVMQIYPYVFFFASAKRVCLWKWIMDAIISHTEKQQEISYPDFILYNLLRSEFKVLSFSRESFTSTLLQVSHKDIPLWNNVELKELQSIVLQEYITILGPSTNLDRMLITMPAKENALEPRLLSDLEMESMLDTRPLLLDLADHITREKNCTRQRALREILAYPCLCNKGDLVLEYDRNAPSDVSALVWRIQMLHQYGLLQYEDLNAQEWEEEKPSLPSLSELLIKPNQFLWPIHYLTWLEIPRALADRLYEANCRTLGQLVIPENRCYLDALLQRLYLFQSAKATIITTKFSKIPFITTSPQSLFKNIFDQGNEGTRAIQVMNMRYLGISLQEIGEKFHLTRERVRQIDARYCERLFKLYIREKNRLNDCFCIQPHVMEDANGKALLGEEVWFCLKHAILECAKPEQGFLRWSGPGLLLFDIREDFQKILDQGALRLDEMDDDHMALSMIAEEMRAAGYCFVSPEHLDAYYTTRGYRWYGNFFSQGKLTMGQAIAYIAENIIKEPVHISDEEHLQHFSEELQKMAIKVTTARALVARLTDVLVLCGRGTYVHPSHVIFPQEIQDEISAYLKTCGHDSITYTELFERFKTQLLKMSSVTNHDALHGAMQLYMPNLYIYQKDLLYTNTEILNIARNSDERVLSYLKERRRAVTLSELTRAFPGWDETRFSFVAQRCPEMLTNGKGQYFWVGHVTYPEERVKRLGEILEATLKKANGVTTDRVMFEAVSRRFPALLNCALINDPGSLFSLLSYHFKDIYRFARPFILGRESSFDNDMTIDQLIKNTLSDANVFSKQEMLQYLSTMFGENTVKGKISELSGRYYALDGDLLITAISVTLQNTIQTELVSVLSRFMENGFTVIANIKWDKVLKPLDFWGMIWHITGNKMERFCIPWNEYIAASMIKKIMPNYRLLENGEDRSTCTVALTADSPFETREDLAIWLLENRYTGVRTYWEMSKWLVYQGLYLKENNVKLVEAPRFRRLRGIVDVQASSATSFELSWNFDSMSTVYDEQEFEEWSQFLKNEQKPISRDRMIGAFSSYTMRKEAQWLEYNKDIISWTKDRLCHVHSLILEEADKHKMMELVELDLERNAGYSNAIRIYQQIKWKMQLFLNDNFVQGEEEFFCILQYWFGDSWFFQYPHILKNWDKGSSFKYENLVKIGAPNGGFERSTLVKAVEARYGAELPQALYGACLEYCRSAIQIDADRHIAVTECPVSSAVLSELDRTLGQVLKEKLAIGTDDADLYEMLPSIAYPWTAFLLRDVVRTKLPQYKVLMEADTQTLSISTALIVPQGSPYGSWAQMAQAIVSAYQKENAHLAFTTWLRKRALSPAFEQACISVVVKQQLNIPINE